MGYKAVVLLSGGIDSAVALWLYASSIEPREVLALTVDYGQPAAREELRAAHRLASVVGCHIDHVEAKRAFPGSRLSAGSGPQGASVVPARNAVLAWLGICRAELEKARDVVLGATLDDEEDYADCSEEFVRALNGTAHVLGLEARLVAPFLGIRKAEVIRLGERFGIKWSETVSCYAPLVDGEPCGICFSCRQRSAALTGSPE
jgi:7-cyano-7-deazaguanine synthase